MRSSTRRFRNALGVMAAMATLAACNDDIVGPESGIPPVAASDMSLAAAENDDFDGAVIITALPFTDSTNTSEALTAVDDPYCAGQGPTVWYTFTAPSDGWYEANTFGSHYDTGLGAYTGTRGNLVEVACNDDTFGLQSQVVIPLAAGETVYFMVSAYGSGPGGNLVFSLNDGSSPPPPPPPPPPFNVGFTVGDGSVDPVTGIALVGGTFTCSLWSYVNIYGVLRQRIGRMIVEAPFWGNFECNGSTPWEVQVRAQNALLVAGRVEIYAEAYFYDFTFGQQAFLQQSATIRLRGARARQSASASLDRTSSTSLEPVRSLADVIQLDSRLPKSAKRSLTVVR